MKLIHLLILFFLLTPVTFLSQIVHDAPDIIEMHKGKKFKPFFGGQKMTIHELIGKSKDTLCYRATTGEFIVKDTNYYLTLKPFEIIDFYFVTGQKEPIDVRHQAKLPSSVVINPTLVSKMVVGRKAYKFMPTRDKEVVWVFGDIYD